jgi:hypothetical protein
MLSNWSVGAAAVLSGVTVMACASAEKPVEAAAPAAPVVVHVTANEYTFTAPDTIASGVTTFHLMNGGIEAHHVFLVKLTMAEFAKMGGEGSPPADLLVAGGANAAMPGGTAEATMDLQPGEYTLVCGIPAPDGQPHMAKGMMRSLVVTQGSSTAVLPATDITLKLTDYDFQFSTPLTAGRHVVRIENAGLQMHEMVMVKLAPGKTAMDFAKWAEKPNGPPPGAAVNGGAPMTVGVVNTVVMDLTPGEYALICFLGDMKDQRPHLMHGMIKQLTIS